MSEARLLVLVWRYPNVRALLRRSRDGSTFAGLARLERLGLVRRQRELYRLTRQGRYELAMSRGVADLVARAGNAR